jgi:hypothetical protein
MHSASTPLTGSKPDLIRKEEGRGEIINIVKL